MILRLLGEASTLKNQLAQIDEYLAGIERETARATREEQVAAAEIERLETARKQLSETMSQRQLELESVTGERRRTEEDLAERRRTAAELRHEIDGVKTEVSQIRARKESLEAGAGAPHLHHGVGEAPVRLARKGQGRGSEAARRAGRLRGSRSAVRKAGGRVPARRAGIRGGARTGQQAERGLDFIRAELDGRATFLVHPEPNGNGTARLPEPAIGPETGIAARLSDSLRLTNGFKDRAMDLMPRVSLCFLAEDRDGGAAAGGRLSAPLFPAAGRRLLSRPHRHRRQEDGRRSAGHEARGARARP